MIFPACINLPASSHYKGMYPHGSPILWYIRGPVAYSPKSLGSPWSTAPKFWAWPVKFLVKMAIMLMFNFYGSVGPLVKNC